MVTSHASATLIAYANDTLVGVGFNMVTGSQSPGEHGGGLGTQVVMAILQAGTTSA